MLYTQRLKNGERDKIFIIGEIQNAFFFFLSPRVQFLFTQIYSLVSKNVSLPVSLRCHSKLVVEQFKNSQRKLNMYVVIIALDKTVTLSLAEPLVAVHLTAL